MPRRAPHLKSVPTAVEDSTDMTSPPPSKDRSGGKPGSRRGKPRRGGGPAPRGPKGSVSGAGGNRYWLSGLHAVSAALANPERRCERLMATRAALAEVEAPVRRRGIPVAEAERAELDRLLGDETVHQGLALEVLPLEPPALSDLADPTPGRPLLVLDQVTDPRNVGAILRAAAVFGAVAVLVQDRHAPPESAALAKAASGALETVPLIRAGNLKREIEALKDAGYWTAGLAGDAEETVRTLPADRPLALILGAEGDGLRRLTREACDQLVRIDMPGLAAGDRHAVDSLNVSAAAAVALYAAATRF
jgi:23S rRNA (guanosine2251-2'-O)-methyltransferase